MPTIICFYLLKLASIMALCIFQPIYSDFGVFRRHMLLQFNMTLNRNIL